jgi:hypothetical protein
MSNVRPDPGLYAVYVTVHGVDFFHVNAGPMSNVRPDPGLYVRPDPGLYA